MLLFTVQTPLLLEAMGLIPALALLAIVLLETFRLVRAIWMAPLPVLLPLIVLLVMSNLAVATVVLASVSIAPKLLPVRVLSVIVVA